MNLNKRFWLHEKKAQTAMELAIFGAILVFILGTIIRQTVGFGYQQNQSLRAMRMAMTMSYACSNKMDFGAPGPDTIFDCFGGSGSSGNASRNTASILLIEDRLTTSAGKYGAIDRVPYVLSGFGSHTKQFFQPIENGEVYNLPRFDMFVNGQHFEFLVAGFKEYSLNQATLTGAGVPLGMGWEPACAEVTPAPYPDTCSAICSPAFCCPACLCIQDPPIDVGCGYFHTRVPNFANSEVWCDGGIVPCEITENIPVEERFDLDFNGTQDVPVVGMFPETKDFSWQWYKVFAFNEGYDQSTTKLNVYPDALVTAGVRVSSNKNIVADFDGDGKEERIVAILEQQANGIFYKVRVIDNQAGDLDFTYDDRTKALGGGPQPGLTNDVQMWTITRDGTYLELDQGKLYEHEPSGAGRVFIRSSQKKDQVDVIQRTVTLSNDTDRFCDAASNPVSGTPIEVCNDCFLQANVTRTCMDETTDPPVIYIRSRIADLHGRKWVTDITDDKYIQWAN